MNLEQEIYDFCANGIEENSEAVSIGESYASGKSDAYEEILELINKKNKARAKSNIDWFSNDWNKVKDNN